MYTAPNRILYAVFKPYDIDDKYDSMIEKLMKDIESIKELKDLSKWDISMAVNNAIISICLGLYNCIAFFGASRDSLHLLNAFELQNTNHRIQNLMMEENASATDIFVNKAIDIIESDEDLFALSLIRRIVRRHLILRDVGFRSRDKVAEKIFDKSKKSQVRTLSLGKNARK